MRASFQVPIAALRIKLGGDVVLLGVALAVGEGVDFRAHCAGEPGLPLREVGGIELSAAAQEGAGEVGVAKKPDDARAWIASAYAFRGLERTPEAKRVLLTVESEHGTNTPLLHYSLARCHSLLGELEEAKERLARACRGDAALKSAALDDPDLSSLWDSWRPPTDR